MYREALPAAELANPILQHLSPSQQLKQPSGMTEVSMLQPGLMTLGELEDLPEELPAADGRIITSGQALHPVLALEVPRKHGTKRVRAGSSGQTDTAEEAKASGNVSTTTAGPSGTSKEPLPKIRKFEKLPPGAEMEKELLRIYKRNTGRKQPKMIKGKVVSLTSIFKAARGLGGYEYVTAKRWWSKVATKWNAEAHTRENIQLVQALYEQGCLEYEHTQAQSIMNNTPDGPNVQAPTQELLASHSRFAAPRPAAEGPSADMDLDQSPVRDSASQAGLHASGSISSNNRAMPMSSVISPATATMPCTAERTVLPMGQVPKAVNVGDSARVVGSPFKIVWDRAPLAPRDPRASAALRLEAPTQPFRLNEERGGLTASSVAPTRSASAGDAQDTVQTEHQALLLKQEPICLHASKAAPCPVPEQAQRNRVAESLTDRHPTADLQHFSSAYMFEDDTAANLSAPGGGAPLAAAAAAVQVQGMKWAVPMAASFMAMCSEDEVKRIIEVSRSFERGFGHSWGEVKACLALCQLFSDRASNVQDIPWILKQDTSRGSHGRHERSALSAGLLNEGLMMCLAAAASQIGSWSPEEHPGAVGGSTPIRCHDPSVALPCGRAPWET
ncbi:hypothetical protein WJX74_006333 [Apatococcus lobatus]|uniref:ARID domain-containing protein n=1 Tax=Apatococcus lobatus TaxID=904363 RepID=A0AAW1Q4Z4_9CHLO